MSELERITTDRPIHGTDALGWAPDEDAIWHRIEGVLAAVDEGRHPGYHTACGIDVDALAERVPTRQTPACEDCDSAAVRQPRALV